MVDHHSDDSWLPERPKETQAEGAVSKELTAKVLGDDAYPIWYRRPLPLDAPRVRYPGFKPGTELLKKGTIRGPGALPLSCDMYLDRDVEVRLRDDIVLYTDIFRPVDDGKYPAILCWSPYGKELGGQLLADLPGRAGVPSGILTELQKWEAPDPGFWVDQGYVIINPDARGAFESGGNIQFWGRQEGEDGYDLIEWSAAQSWSNGKIGMAGNSWLAVVQWFIAAERPPHLAAIAPWEGASDIFREMQMPGGVPMIPFLEAIVQTFAGTHLVEDITKMTLLEQTFTPYWQNKAARLENIDIPTYVVASYDNFLHTEGTLNGYGRIRSKDKWLRIHDTHEWADQYDPNHVKELLDFFDCFLKGETNNGWAETPRIRMSVLDPGRTNEVNRVVDEWPPRGYTHEQLFLDSGGTLVESIPETGQVSYPVAGGKPAVFTKTITQEAELVGSMKLCLWVEAIDADDMDLVLVVEKLDENGEPLPHFSQPVKATSYQRASRRELDPNLSTPDKPHLSYGAEQRLSPGQIVQLEVGFWPLALRLHVGDILQLSVMPYVEAPMPIPFGTAIIQTPTDSFTYEPGTAVPLQALGGAADTSPQWSRDQTVVGVPRNAGIHRLHMGGAHDSHLLVPLKNL